MASSPSSLFLSPPPPAAAAAPAAPAAPATPAILGVAPTLSPCAGGQVVAVTVVGWASDGSSALFVGAARIVPHAIDAGESPRDGTGAPAGASVTVLHIRTPPLAAALPGAAAGVGTDEALVDLRLRVSLAGPEVVLPAVIFYKDLGDAPPTAGAVPPYPGGADPSVSVSASASASASAPPRPASFSRTVLTAEQLLAMMPLQWDLSSGRGAAQLPLCARCDDSAKAFLRCQECCSTLCVLCFRDLHKMKWTRHTLSPLLPLSTSKIVPLQSRPAVATFAPPTTVAAPAPAPAPEPAPAVPVAPMVVQRLQPPLAQPQTPPRPRQPPLPQPQPQPQPQQQQQPQPQPQPQQQPHPQPQQQPQPQQSHPQQHSAPPATKVCGLCGMQVPGIASFCPGCGKPLWKS